MLNSQHVEILKSLRAVFLSEEPTEGKDYWQSEEHLAAYDSIFGERIAWKWDAVLNELNKRRLLNFPDSLEIIDWGCGSGRATRSFLAQHPPSPTTKIIVSDRSELAMNWAKQKIKLDHPALSAAQLSTELSDITRPQTEKPFRLFLLSHVVGELSSRSLGEAMSMLRSFADAVIWVDAGTHTLSRKLGQIRDQLKSGFSPLAPCTHERACPMLETANHKHWCHFFTKAPAGVLNDADWIEASETLGLDLRSTPYSFLFLKKKLPVLNLNKIANWHRSIGRPRVYKGYLKIQSCSQEHGLKEFRLQKRDDAQLYKDLAKNKQNMPPIWELVSQEDLNPIEL